MCLKLAVVDLIGKSLLRKCIWDSVDLEEWKCTCSLTYLIVLTKMRQGLLRLIQVSRAKGKNRITLVSAHTSVMNTVKGNHWLRKQPSTGCISSKEAPSRMGNKHIETCWSGNRGNKRERNFHSAPFRQPNIKLRRPTHTVPKTCKISAGPTQRCSENKEATCITTSRNKCERPPDQTAYGSSRPLMLLL